jgi:tripartite-type tricarboxylate transporter receptor subunit TctC
MKLPRRQFLHLAAGAAALPATSRIARAQAYPSRPVRIIASAAAGTAMDVHGRLHGQWLSERLGQPFIVENRPGAASTIGAAEAIRSRPDGYTLFLLPISLAVTANFYSKLPYNIVHDTSPIALLYQANYVMVVNPIVSGEVGPRVHRLCQSKPGEGQYGVTRRRFDRSSGGRTLQVNDRC